MGRIDSYQFGRIVVDGHTYSSDMIIFPDRVQDTWWIKSSHALTIEDIRGAINENPEVLIVGTGASGMMKVLPEVKQELELRNIKLITGTTGETYEIHNQLSRFQKAVAALHLTC